MLLPRGPIEYSFHFIGVANGTDAFSLHAEIRRFEILKMLYPPEGGCECCSEWFQLNILFI